MSTNLQIAEKPINNPDGEVDIAAIFPTLQGEGPFAGMPAVFIRLAGCNLQCPACDTDYTTGRRRMTLQLILNNVLAVLKDRTCELIVITGGEPFRQTGLIPLITMLQFHGYTVQIETNGTIWRPGLLRSMTDHPYHICVSPKTPDINALIRENAHSFKYILNSNNVSRHDGLPTSVLGLDIVPARPSGNTEIYLQPEWSDDQNIYRKNLDAVLESCVKHGYRVSEQRHKFWGVE